MFNGIPFTLMEVFAGATLLVVLAIWFEIKGRGDNR